MQRALDQLVTLPGCSAWRGLAFGGAQRGLGKCSLYNGAWEKRFLYIWACWDNASCTTAEGKCILSMAGRK
eukprot:363514-Chlamydomonas_euryale.AAC.3